MGDTFSLLCFNFPQTFSACKFTIQPGLMLIMFFMGLTLKPIDFLKIVKLKKVIGITALMQYLFMPFIAYSLCVVFDLDEYLLIGVVLVGSVPGGTASNVIVFLAKGEVALSIVLTFISTLLSIVLTPLLTFGYLGQRIDVPVLSMLLGILKIVFFPIFLGMVINHYCKEWLDNKSDFFAVLSVLTIVWIIGVVVSLNTSKLADIGLILTLVVILHNLIGTVCGFFTARILGWNKSIAKTVAIEIGMQNSGLAVVIAIKYFSINSALHAAIFSIWHNISGGLLASFWRLEEKTNKKSK